MPLGCSVALENWLCAIQNEQMQSGIALVRLGRACRSNFQAILQLVYSASPRESGSALKASPMTSLVPHWIRWMARAIFMSRVP